MDKRIIITFESVAYAMRAEKMLKEAGLDLRTIPTPRAISNSCGLSIMTDYENLDEVNSLIEKGLVVKALYKKEGDEITII